MLIINLGVFPKQVSSTRDGWRRCNCRFHPSYPLKNWPENSFLYPDTVGGAKLWSKFAPHSQYLTSWNLLARRARDELEGDTPDRREMQRANQEGVAFWPLDFFFFYLMGSHVSSDDICFELKQWMLISERNYCKGRRALKLQQLSSFPLLHRHLPNTQGGLPHLQVYRVRHSEMPFES